MKKILLLACFATSTLMLKAQSFTLTELVNMVKMNVDDFDTNVSNKGYKYFKPFDNEDGSTKGSQYAYKQSGDGKASRFVGLHYEYFIPSDKNVVFQTSQLLEYQKIKNQMSRLF